MSDSDGYDVPDGDAERFDHYTLPMRGQKVIAGDFQFTTYGKDVDEDGVVYTAVGPGDVAFGGFIKPNSANMIEPRGCDTAFCFSLGEGVVTVTAGDAAGVALFAQHERNRGGLPELNPPAKPGGPGAEQAHPVPRALDRSLDYDAANEMVQLLRNHPLWYAITFPESEAPDLYVRALAGFDSIHDDWDSEKEYVAVRRERRTGTFEKRWVDVDYFANRMTRADAVRLVCRRDAPDALYPEVYRSDD